MARNFHELAEQYIAIWNETDARKRRQEIDDLWAPDARYVDPMAVAEGRDAIDTMIATAQHQFSGMTFRLAGPVDGHHDQVRFSWELGPEGGAAPIAGFDVAVADHNGQFSQVLGFLDRVPAA